MKKTSTGTFSGIIAVIFFSFFLLKLVPTLFLWVDDTGAWVFLILIIIFGAKPLYNKFKN